VIDVYFVGFAKDLSYISNEDRLKKQTACFKIPPILHFVLADVRGTNQIDRFRKSVDIGEICRFFFYPMSRPELDTQSKHFRIFLESSGACITRL